MKSILQLLSAIASAMILLLSASASISQADETSPATLTPAELQYLKYQLLGGLDISFSGYARIEGRSEQHFDLGSTLLRAGGAGNYFYDFRGWLGSRIAKGPAALHISVDYAGNDFSDSEGGILGNGLDSTATPGGPAVVRQICVSGTCI